MSPRAPLRAMVVVATVAALATVASASAPPDQYGIFEGTTPVITDNFTGLTWERYPQTSLVNYDEALVYCQAKDLGSLSWRLPSYKELETLVDDYPHTEYSTGIGVQVFIDANAFFGTSTDWPFWTSSLTPGSTNIAYAVSFANAAASDQPTSTSLHVRCVTP